MAKIKILVDPESITLGDLADLETYGGVTFGDLQEQKPLTARGIMALAWIAQRREIPGLKFEDMRKVKMSDLDFAQPEPDPPTAVSETAS